MADRANDRLKALRIAAGFATAGEAALAFGWNVNTYRSLENGNRAVTARNVRRYADAFGVAPGALLEGQTAPPRAMTAPDAAPAALEPRLLRIRYRALGWDDLVALPAASLLLSNVFLPAGVRATLGVAIASAALRPDFEPGAVLAIGAVRDAAALSEAERAQPERLWTAFWPARGAGAVGALGLLRGAPALLVGAERDGLAKALDGAVLAPVLAAAPATASGERVGPKFETELLPARERLYSLPKPS